MIVITMKFPRNSYFTFPTRTCSDTATPLTIKLKKEETFSKEIGHATCTVKELLKENGEGNKYTVFLRRIKAHMSTNRCSYYTTIAG